MRIGLPLAVLVGVLAALLTWTRPGQTDRPTRCDAVAIQVRDNGFHTDLAAPRRTLVASGGPLGRAVAALPPGDWILIGWGDARFYVDQRPIADRLPDGARAFFRPGNPAVVMLDPETADSLSSYGEDAATLTLTSAQFDRLAARIEASLDLSDGAPRIVAARPGDDARFLASRETFSLLHLCNHWTAGVLNAGGVSIRPVQSVSSSEVMRSVRAAERRRKRAAELDTAAPRA